VEYVITPPPITTVEVAGSAEVWPVRRVFCLGRNYAEHVREMGGDPDREPPFFFNKPSDAVVPARGFVPYPPLTSDLHFEVELVVAIDKTATNVSAENALGYVFGYAVGVDLTRRDLQNEAKLLRRPWEWGKAFDSSAPVTALHPSNGVLGAGAIWLSVNGEEKQRADLADMIWTVAEIIAAASASVTLQPGDLIFTGTPAGVGRLEPGDVVTGGIAGIDEFEFTIAPALP
jgi:fumarylpyruvate hydrolase